MVWVKTVDRRMDWYLCTKKEQRGEEYDLYSLLHMNGIDCYAQAPSCKQLIEILSRSDVESFRIYPTEAYEIELIPRQYGGYCRREIVE